MADDGDNVRERHPGSLVWARWIGAIIAITYGFAKLNGSQFTILDSELTRPLGEVSGFWLTWYYFGYSIPYKWMIAGLEIAGGVLLSFRRTAAHGALMLLPLAANVVLIDVFFGYRLGRPPCRGCVGRLY